MPAQANEVRPTGALSLAFVGQAVTVKCLKVTGGVADLDCVTIDDDLEGRELMLNRFRRLLGEVQRGQVLRNSFARWEIDLLLDFSACDIEPRRRSEILGQYERAVERQLDAGPGPPMRLSHFLVLRSQR